MILMKCHRLYLPVTQRSLISFLHVYEGTYLVTHVTLIDVLITTFSTLFKAWQRRAGMISFYDGILCDNIPRMA